MRRRRRSLLVPRLLGQEGEEVPAGLLLAGGKLVSRREVNNLGGLIFLQDDKTKQQFLVDTGAAVSLLPYRSSEPPSGPGLSGPDGKPIPSWGTVSRRLTCGLHTFFVSFILAAVTRPILGLDFLSTHNLLIDPVARLLLDAKTHLPINDPTALCSVALSCIPTAVHSYWPRSWL